MRELALFAGAGGGILGGVLSGWRTVCAVEIEPYCREVLLRRQRDGVLPLFPIWDDIRTFDGRPWRGLVDVVSGGFPCQPFSVAGKQLGAADERNLWPETIRVLREVRPEFAFLENVPALLSSGYFGTVLGDLAEAGFDAEWGVLSAAECGAPHRRERVWIVAHADSRRGGEDQQQGESRAGVPVESSDPARTANGTEGNEGPGRSGWWDEDPGESASVESGMGRVAHGIPYRVHRLRALGNGQVCEVARRAWEELR